MKTITLQTGVAGLDRILGLRLPADAESGRAMGAILIQGEPGTGKTLLALTLASRAALSFGKPACALYACAEQSPEEVALFARQFSLGLPVPFWTAREFVEQRDARPPACVLNALDPSTLLTRPGGGAAEALRDQFDQWRDALAKRGCQTGAIVLDGLMQGVHAVGAMDRASLQDLARYGMDHGLLVVVVEETGRGSEWLPFAFDVVVRLAHAPGHVSTEIQMRRLTVVKSRFSAAAEGQHVYEIGRDGFAVYPAMHAYSPRNVARPPEVEQGREPLGRWGNSLFVGYKIPRGTVILYRGAERDLYESSDAFFTGLDDPEREFAIDLVLNPRSVRLHLVTALKDALRVDDTLVLGDQATPPEKLLHLLLSAVESWAANTGRRVARARLGDLRALRVLPKQRAYQFIQIAARSLVERGASVLVMTSGAEDPDEVSFHANIRITELGGVMERGLREVTEGITPSK